MSYTSIIPPPPWCANGHLGTAFRIGRTKNFYPPFPFFKKVYPTTLIIFNFCCPISGRLRARYTVTADTVLRRRFRYGPRSRSSRTSSMQLIKSFYGFCGGMHRSNNMGRWRHLIIVLYAGRQPLWLAQSMQHKGKAVPLQAWSGPEGSGKSTFPDFMTTARVVVRLPALRTGRLYSQETKPGTHFC